PCEVYLFNPVCERDGVCVCVCVCGVCVCGCVCVACRLCCDFEREGCLQQGAQHSPRHWAVCAGGGCVGFFKALFMPWEKLIQASAPNQCPRRIDNLQSQKSD